MDPDDLEGMDGLSQQGIGLCDLPPTILKQHVLSWLDPKSLCRMAAAGNRQIRRCCDTDKLWQPLAESKGWTRLGEERWKAAFLRNQAQTCVSCGQYTKYEFAFTGERLCGDCEQANPDKYALVTLCEASEAFALTAADLSNLKGPLKKLGTSLYLRYQVMNAVAAKTTRAPASQGGDEESHEEEDDSEEESMAPLRKEKQSKADKKAARKANKKQVKQQQRAKRLLGSSPPSASMPRSLGSSTCADSWMGTSPESGSSPLIGSYLMGSSPPSSGGMHRRKAPSSNSRRQAHVRHTNEACEGPSMRTVSTCSSWIQERERLMAEYGEFGISGLVLANDPC